MYVRMIWTHIAANIYKQMCAFINLHTVGPTRPKHYHVDCGIVEDWNTTEAKKKQHEYKNEGLSNWNNSRASWTAEGEKKLGEKNGGAGSSNSSRKTKLKNTGKKKWFYAACDSSDDDDSDNEDIDMQEVISCLRSYKQFPKNIPLKDMVEILSILWDEE